MIALLRVLRLHILHPSLQHRTLFPFHQWAMRSPFKIHPDDSVLGPGHNVWLTFPAHFVPPAAYHGVPAAVKVTASRAALLLFSQLPVQFV
jgi:hypothetical protein